MTLLSEPLRFSFRRRPIPVPGDLRIVWRVSIVVLMLGNSRSRQASLAKLHILNDAIRSEQSVHLLDLIVSAHAERVPWTLRIEPAFARAIDFVVGDKLANWTQCANRSGLQLTPEGGVVLFKALNELDGVLTPEKDLLEKYAKSMTEKAVSTVISAKRRRE